MQDAAERYLKILLGIALGMLFIWLGVTGRLGSLLGAIITPEYMAEGEHPGSGSVADFGTTGTQTQPSGGTNNITLTPSQIVGYARQAGFRGDGLVTITAIALAESGGQTHGKDNVNTDGSRDRGLYQINSRWHPEVSDAQAYNAITATQAAFRISNNGLTFTPWSTYTNGAYKQYLATAQQAVGTTPLPLRP